MIPDCSKKTRGLGCSEGGLGNAIHHDVTADSVACFVNTYPLASDLSGG